MPPPSCERTAASHSVSVNCWQRNWRCLIEGRQEVCEQSGQSKPRRVAICTGRTAELRVCFPRSFLFLGLQPRKAHGACASPHFYSFCPDHCLVILDRESEAWSSALPCNANSGSQWRRFSNVEAVGA